MKITVPGNLLLFGEYAITIPNGKGIAAAVDCWANLEAKKANRLSVLTVFEGKEHFWSPGNSLIDAILATFEHIAPLPNLEISINTNDFAYSDGTKKGFGSSAAVAVGLMALLLSFSEISFSNETLFSLALQAHRSFQSGRGSGYDIAASLFGGIGLFTGGDLPSWKPLQQASWWAHLFLVRGDEKTDSRDALRHFERLKKENPRKIQEFVSETNALVEEMLSCEDSAQAQKIFQAAAEKNRELHQLLEMTSEGHKLRALLDSYRSQGYAAKTLGAGGELAAVLCPNVNGVPLPKLTISSEGWRRN